MVQGACVVQAQAFHVDHFEPGFAEFGGHHRQVRQFAVGENVALDEIPGAAAHGASVGVLGGDAMVHHQSAFAHRAKQGFAVLRQVGVADVFEHAHAHHFVETTVLGQVTVIEQLQVHLIVQALGFHACLGQGQLLLAQGDAEHLYPELPRRIPRQPAPTTADIKQILPRLQAQLAAQVAEFVLLGLIDGFAAGFKITAGIRHVLVEPQLVELVGQVVMVGNRRCVSGLVVERAHRTIAPIVIDQGVTQLVTHPDHLGDGAFQLQFALDEGFAQ